MEGQPRVTVEVGEVVDSGCVLKMEWPGFSG